MKFIADEGVDAQIVTALREQENDVMSSMLPSLMQERRYPSYQPSYAFT